jgi:rhodanese-related sulfurtransferase
MEISMMDIENIFKDYWPILLIGIWFLYKKWNTQRVVQLLPKLRKKGAVVIDVRSKSEFAQSNAQGSINIPLNELESSLNKIPKNSPIILCCASGTRSGMAKSILFKNGFKDVHNVGSWTNLI